MAALPPLLAVGRVARAHGVRGRILVAPFNPESQGLERAPAFWLGRPGAEPRRYEVARAERAHLGYLIALRGLDDRDAADALRGAEVSIERAALPALEEGEVWAADLIGMKAVDQFGVERGVVVSFEAAGPNELLALRTPEGEVLIPLAFVEEVEEGVVALRVPEGLFEAQTGPAGPREGEE